MYSLASSDHDTREVSGHLHIPVGLLTGKGFPVPVEYEAGWDQTNQDSVMGK